MINDKRRLRNDERICKVCGKIFRVRRKGGRKKYCSKFCANEIKKRQMFHRNSLGTSTKSLGVNEVKKQLDRIRNYHGNPIVSDSLSYRDILVNNAVYVLDDDNNYYESIDSLEED